jgi:hypothetical protein
MRLWVRPFGTINHSVKFSRCDARASDATKHIALYKRTCSISAQSHSRARAATRASPRLSTFKKEREPLLSLAQQSLTSFPLPVPYARYGEGILTFFPFGTSDSTPDGANRPTRRIFKPFGRALGPTHSQRIALLVKPLPTSALRDFI